MRIVTTITLGTAAIGLALSAGAPAEARLFGKKKPVED
jgi:flagellar L-ring protein precursor FlgH